MSIKIKFPIIFICFFLTLLITQTNSFAAIFILRSSALQTVFDQAEATYLSRIAQGLTTQFAIENAPAVFAQSVGLAMQRQLKYMPGYGDYMPQLKVLINEAESFMKQLARAHNYRHPRNGSNLPEARLGYEFSAGLGGVYNEAWIGLGIDPAKVGLPFMLSLVAPPQNTSGNGGPPLAKIQVKKNEISLFGNVAPSAESADESQAPPKPEKQADNYSGPRQLGGGCQCSQQAPITVSSTSNVTIWLDCNGDPYDNTYVICGYKGTERGYYLGDQSSYVNDKRHGVSRTWSLNKATGRPYLRVERNYFNGKMHGPSKYWEIDEKSGRVYLAKEEPYVNGIRHGTVIDYRPNGTVSSRAQYIDSKFIKHF